MGMTKLLVVLAACAAASVADTLEIVSMEAFEQLQEDMAGSSTGYTKDVVLLIDLDLTNMTRPLGTKEDGTCVTFSGSLVGNGHAVANMSLNTTLDDGALFCGLKDAVVSDLVFDDSSSVHVNKSGAMLCVLANGNVTLTHVASAGSVSAIVAGGLVAKSAGDLTLSDCHNSGAITAKGESALGAGLVAQAEDLSDTSGSTLKLTDCSNSGYINTGNTKSHVAMGGIIATASTFTNEFTNCTNKGTINTQSGLTSAAIGGVVAEFLGGKATIDSCANSGNLELHSTNRTICGGIVGTAQLTNMVAFDVVGCANSGKLSNDEHNSPELYVGGIIGQLYQSNPSPVTVVRCNNTGAIESKNSNFGGGYVAGIIGLTNQLNMTSCMNTGGLSAQSMTCGLVCTNTTASQTDGVLVYNSANAAEVDGTLGYGISNAVFKADNVVNTGAYYGPLRSAALWGECEELCENAYQSANPNETSTHVAKVGDFYYDAAHARVDTLLNDRVEERQDMYKLWWDYTLHLDFTGERPETPSSLVEPSFPSSSSLPSAPSSYPSASSSSTSSSAAALTTLAATLLAALSLVLFIRL